ncbi:MAG: type II toxin-antitoxin system HicA family toxin [Nitrososphaerales archaeon]
MKTLVKLGFEPRPTKGSHVFLKHSDGRTTTVPVHAGEEIDRRLLKKIAADIEMSADEFVKLIE